VPLTVHEREEAGIGRIPHVVAQEREPKPGSLVVAATRIKRGGTREHPRLARLELEVLSVCSTGTPAAIEIGEKSAVLPVGRRRPMRVEHMAPERPLELIREGAPSRRFRECRRDLSRSAGEWANHDDQRFAVTNA
jgi:hypothetical protein